MRYDPMLNSETSIRQRANAVARKEQKRCSFQGGGRGMGRVSRIAEDTIAHGALMVQTFAKAEMGLRSQGGSSQDAALGQTVI